MDQQNRGNIDREQRHGRDVSHNESGPYSLTDVSLYDYLPWEHSTYQRDAVATAGEVISDIVSVEWSGDLAPYSTYSLTMTVIVDPEYEGPIANTAVISHASLDSPVIIGTVGYVSDKPVLEIEKTASAANAEEGDELIYTIQVRNLGARATQLEVYDILPSALAYVFYSATGNGELDGDQLQWLIPLLETGESRTLTFSGLVEGSGRIVNGDYWVTSAEGVTATGPPAITFVSGGGLIYLPLVLK